MKRRKFAKEFKAKVALEAIKGQRTANELAQEFGVHVNQIRQWRRQLLEELPSIFVDGMERSENGSEQLTAELYRQIGQLKVELDWLKKSFNAPLSKSAIW